MARTGPLLTETQWKKIALAPEPTQAAPRCSALDRELPGVGRDSLDNIRILQPVGGACGIGRSQRPRIAPRLLISGDKRHAQVRRRLWACSCVRPSFATANRSRGSEKHSRS